MFLKSLATAVPPKHYGQKELWEIYCRTSASRTLRPASNELMRRIMTSDKRGIERRHLALEPGEGLVQMDGEALNAAFEREAPKLAEAALKKALEEAAWVPEQLDALFICTCTGYLCPGVSSYVAEAISARSDIFLQDLVGLGCGAAIPTLRSVDGFLKRQTEARVAMIAVEICSAAFYLDDNAGVLISASIFGDGAAATLWQSTPAENGAWQAGAFDTVHWPEERESLRFQNRHGKLRNVLKPTVPAIAGKAVRHLAARYMQQHGQPSAIVAHGGGRNVLLELEESFPDHDFTTAWEVLQGCGNMSSPSVLFALERFLQNHGEAGTAWLTSFGAGFSGHSMHLRRTNGFIVEPHQIRTA
jgi:predicted naringenin-chalcone synthase